MASIRKRGGRFAVHWRFPRSRDGVQRTHTCPDLETARRVRADVDRALARGEDWRPGGDPAARGLRPDPAPDLNCVFAAYLEDVARTCAAGTARRHGESLMLFDRYLRAREGVDEAAPLPASLLSQAVLADFWGWLRRTPGRGTDGAAVATANRRVRVVEQAWRWIADRDEHEAAVRSGALPRPRKIRVPAPAQHRVVAPTWAEMDAVIAVLTSWHRALAIVLRFTGLRPQQAMMLRRPDLDLDRAILVVRPDLPGTKTARERAGREIPVSPHLVAEVRTWPAAEGPWLIPSNRRGARERIARPRDMQRAWARGGVRPEVWQGEAESHGHAHKAFRRGFQTELSRAGADEAALDHLVGHQGRTVRDRHYRDPDSLPLREAVALIPPLLSAEEALRRARAAAEGRKVLPFPGRERGP